MRIEAIKGISDKYKLALGKGVAKPEYLLRLCIQQWQEVFDIDEMHMGPLLDKALKNSVSGRFWGGENHSIKSGLILLANHNVDLFWEAIKDLFHEDRMIIMRANRFIHHCDVIFKDYKTKEKKVNTHYQSYYSATLLLSLQYPERYCIYDWVNFEKFCIKIGVKELPVENDLERYYKILSLVYSVMAKDEKLMESYYSKLEDGIYFGPSLSFMNDVMEFANS